MGTEGKTNLDGPEMTDEQTRAQVVDPAKKIVQSAGLQLRGASFRFSACTDQGVAPFRGRVSMGFTFPPDIDKQAYIDAIVADMRADGWKEGAPEGKQPHGRALHLGEVMAIVTPNPDHPDRGYIQIFGECRNAADHDGEDQDIRAELTG